MSKSLIIVESPAKARTLQKYLGKAFEVKASVGHIRDLPEKTLGVDVDHDFAPKYVTIKGKTKVLSELKKAAEKADDIYLAPDPDREGEAIAYHIAETLKGIDKPIHRALFHELTKKAILDALEKATSINQHLFEAQQARRILDRLVGYQVSPLLWKKVRGGLSAGRVQSVAVRMICEREKAIREFVPEEYWSIGARLEGVKPPAFIAMLERAGGKKLSIANQEQADAITAELKRISPYTVEKIEKKEKKRHPSPPFITSSLQIEANRKLRFSAKKTMTLAQRLYEGVELGAEGPVGLITYMRTDSTRVNAEALDAVRAFIAGNFEAATLPAKPNLYKAKDSAQDAHEAIRPTDVTRTPESLAHVLEKDLLNLYTLIWKRFVASQMTPALYDQTTVLVAAGKYQLKAVGSIIRFLGFMVLYVEAEEETAGDGGGDKEEILPELAMGNTLKLLELLPKQHFTQPPPRFTEATLVKALEENGVGRPSTYAAIISTIVDKEYVLLVQRKFEPTDLGFIVNDLLVKHFPEVFDIDFTASMEKNLDRIAEGETQWQRVLKDFYGPFRQTLDQAAAEMQSLKRAARPTDIKCEQCGGTMMIKWGRMGEFLACENFPKCKSTGDFTRDENGEIRMVQKPGPEETDEKCEKCGRPMVLKQGKYGPFLACSGYPDCKNIRSQGTGVKCPAEGCTGELIRKVSKKGKVFYSCNRYPKCTMALWDKPVNRPCPMCGAAFVVEATTRRDGPHLRCSTKDCKFREKLAEEPAPAESPAA